MVKRSRGRASRMKRKVKRGRRNTQRGGGPIVVYAGSSPGTYTTTAPPANCSYKTLGTVTLQKMSSSVPWSETVTGNGAFLIGPRTNMTATGKWDNFGDGSAGSAKIDLAFTKTIAGVDITSILSTLPSTSRVFTAGNVMGDLANPVFFKLTSADGTSEVVFRVHGVDLTSSKTGMVGLYSYFTTSGLGYTGTAPGVSTTASAGAVAFKSIIKSQTGTPTFGGQYSLSYGQCKNLDTPPSQSYTLTPS